MAEKPTKPAELPLASNGDVKAYDRQGNKITVPKDQVGALYALGGRVASVEEVRSSQLDEEYEKSSTLQKIGGLIMSPLQGDIIRATGLAEPPTATPGVEAFKRGAKNAFTLGLDEIATKGVIDATQGKDAARAYGQHILDIKETERGLYTAGELTGMAGQMFIPGAGAARGGAGLARLIPGVGVMGAGGAAERAAANVLAGVAERGVAGRAAATAGELAIRGGVEGALYGGAHELTEEALGDKGLAADKIFAAAGLGGLVGGFGGAALGGTGSLAKSALGAGQRGLAGMMSRRAAARAEEAAVDAAPGGGRVSIDPDAGLRGTAEAIERPFSIGREERPFRLMPDVGQRGAVEAEELPLIFGGRRGRVAKDPGGEMRAIGAQTLGEVDEAAQRVLKRPPAAETWHKLQRSPEGYSIKIDRFVADESGLEIYGKATTADGEKFAGDFGITLKRDGKQLVAHIDNLFLEPAHQSKGLGAAIAKNLDDTSRALGVSEVRLNASQVGRYVWAKAGYEWDGRTGREMAAGFRGWLERNGHNPELASVVAKGPKAMADTPLGKSYLLSEDAPMWHGVKQLGKEVRLGSMADDLGEVATKPALRPAGGKVERPVSFGEVGGEIGSTPAIRMEAQAATPTRLKELAADQAWRAINSGGLSPTRHAAKASKFLPNGTNDVGEVMLRRGIIETEGGALSAAKLGKPGELLPRIQSELDVVGARIGEITDASGARIDARDLDAAFRKVRSEYAKIAGYEHVVEAIDLYGVRLREKLGMDRNGSASVQAVLEQRKGLDRLVWEETKTLDPKGRVAALREVRTELERTVTDALDRASGKAPGVTKGEYQAVKKDFLALSIAREVAEDSATRMSKGLAIGLRDAVLGGGGITGTMQALGHKVIRERGNAAAAAYLYKASEMSAIAKTIRFVDEQLGRSSRGLLAPPAKRPLPELTPKESPRIRADKAMKEVAAFEADPDAFATRIAHSTESMGAGAPQIAGALAQRATSAMTFLSSKRPVAADRDPLDPHPAPRMSDAQAAEFARYHWYTQRPMRFFEELEHGKMTHEGAEVARALMPQAFAELQMRMLDAIATHMTRGRAIPFQQRVRIGTLLDIPADPSLRPQHMLFLQENVLPAPPDAKLPGASGGGRKPLKTPDFTNALDRMEAR